MSQWLSDELKAARAAEAANIAQATQAAESGGIAPDELWQRIREPRAHGERDRREVEQMSEVSSAVREAIARDDATLQAASSIAFAAIHQRLMNEIEASTASASTAPQTAHDVAAPAMRIGTKPMGREVGHVQSTLRGRWSNWGHALSRGASLRAAAALAILIAVGAGGHQAGLRRAGVDDGQLPAQSLVDDYVAGLDTQPLEIRARTPRQTAQWLSKRIGHRVQMPETQKLGVRLLGARLHAVGGRPSAQTHFLKNGVRLALYQIHAPHYGLSTLGEVQWNRQSFFTGHYGACHLVVWRKDDDIMALVSPFELRESLSVAGSMRASTHSEDADSTNIEPI